MPKFYYLLPHETNFLDLAHSEDFLFQNLKKWLWDKCYVSNKAVINDDIEKNLYLKGLQPDKLNV